MSFFLSLIELGSHHFLLSQEIQTYEFSPQTHRMCIPKILKCYHSFQNIFYVSVIPPPALFFTCFVIAVFLNFLARGCFKCPFAFDVSHHTRRTWNDPVQIYIMAHYKVLGSNSRQIFHDHLKRVCFCHHCIQNVCYKDTT